MGSLLQATPEPSTPQRLFQQQRHAEHDIFAPGSRCHLYGDRQSANQFNLADTSAQKRLELVPVSRDQARTEPMG